MNEMLDPKASLGHPTDEKGSPGENQKPNPGKATLAKG